MYEADRLAVEAGRSGVELMDAAGRAVADTLMTRWENRPVIILCGPGNNGGDGFVAARYLEQSGWSIQLYILGSIDQYTGDALHHAKAWQTESTAKVRPLQTLAIQPHCIVIDALFGAGLARPISNEIEELFTNITSAGCPVVAVDLPSGISGDSGEVMGAALPADITVTFFRKKYGHLLYPGAGYAGEVVIADIGIPETAIATINPGVHENAPDLWADHYPVPANDGHKYLRGHALILGGETMTGAARLAARAARRMGAGLSSIATRPSSFAIYATGDPGTIIEPFNDLKSFLELLVDTRKNAVLIGPGAGVSPETRNLALAALGSGKSVVLDADGLTVFQDDPQALTGAIQYPCVMTPHEGEFKRLFGYEGHKIDRARQASRDTGAVVLLKGPDTVIASPDDRVIINTNAVPDLATAGAGDVLAGIIVALMAQSMSAFDAASAGTWIHGAASAKIGPGLVAEDLCEVLPEIITFVRAIQSRDLRQDRGRTI